VVLIEEMRITEDDVKLAEKLANMHLSASIGKPRFQTNEMQNKKIQESYVQSI
jgi:hypothetical protein